MLLNTRLLTVAVAVALAGCGTMKHRSEIQNNTADGQKTVDQRVTQTRVDDQKKAESVRVIDGVWLGAQMVKVAREGDLPMVFDQPIAFQFPDNPLLNVLADRIGKIAGMIVRVTPDALIQPKSAGAKSGSVAVPPLTGQIGGTVPSMSNQYTSPEPRFIIDSANPFNGTLADLLDKICAKHGVGWDYKDGAILVSRYVTRTYQLSSILDVNDLNAGISKTANLGANTSTTGVAGGSTSNGSTSTSEVSSKITAKIDAVKGISQAITDMLTPDTGKFSISSSGIITVTDTREVQEQVKELIKAENNAVGRQVKVRMQIVQIEDNRTDNLGIDWAWVIDNVARKWNVNMSSPTAPLNGATGLGQIGVIHNGDGTSSALLQALSEIGKVSVRRDETYMTLNNRLLSTATTDNFIYPASTTPGSSSTSGGTVQPGVTPGQLTTGTFLNIRTNIQPNKSVIMQFSMDSSVRGQVQTLDAGNGVKLQFPQSSGNQYQLYASAVSGETAVLVGMDNSDQQTTDRSLDGALSPLLGGGVAAATKRRAVLVLLTPTIVEGVN